MGRKGENRRSKCKWRESEGGGMCYSWPVMAVVLLCSVCSSAQLTITLTFISDTSGITLSGSGSSAATAAFGSVRAFGGTVPSGVTKSVGANTWTLSTPMDVQVQKGTLDLR